MRLETQASVEVKAEPETVFDFATSLSTLPKVFTGYGPIPAILKAEIIAGKSMETGVIRKVWNSDGSIVDEEIVELIRPTTQRYRLIRGFKPPFSYIFREASGEWTLSSAPLGTNIVWKFYFELTSPLVQPIAQLIGFFFVRAQRQCLINIKTFVEAEKDSRSFL